VGRIPGRHVKDRRNVLKRVAPPPLAGRARSPRRHPRATSTRTVQCAASARSTSQPATLERTQHLARTRIPRQHQRNFEHGRRRSAIRARPAGRQWKKEQELLARPARLNRRKGGRRGGLDGGGRRPEGVPSVLIDRIRKPYRVPGVIRSYHRVSRYFNRLQAGPAARCRAPRAESCGLREREDSVQILPQVRTRFHDVARRTNQVRRSRHPPAARTRSGPSKRSTEPPRSARRTASRHRYGPARRCPGRRADWPARFRPAQTVRGPGARASWTWAMPTS